MKMCLTEFRKAHVFFMDLSFSLVLFNRWPDDGPIDGSKLVSLCNNKPPFVVSDGFFYIYFGPALNEEASPAWFREIIVCRSSYA
jgi:hypothetical protein